MTRGAGGSVRAGWGDSRCRRVLLCGPAGARGHDRVHPPRRAGAAGCGTGRGGRAARRRGGRRRTGGRGAGVRARSAQPGRPPGRRACPSGELRTNHTHRPARLARHPSVTVSPLAGCAGPGSREACGGQTRVEARAVRPSTGTPGCRVPFDSLSESPCGTRARRPGRARSNRGIAPPHDRWMGPCASPGRVGSPLENGLDLEADSASASSLPSAAAA